MKNHNNLTTLSFEDKVKLLDETEKTCTVKLIDQLMTERRRKRQSAISDDREKLPPLKEDN